MSADELVEDAESIGRLEFTSGPEPVARSHAYTFSFPPQEHKLGVNQDVADPETGDKAGEIIELDREAGTLVLKRGPSLVEKPLPEALIPKDVYRTNDQEDALERLARSLLARDHRYPAAESILRREPFERDVQHEDLTQLVLSLGQRHLVVQGPPGSGKTWTIGQLIPALVAAGKTVGVASQSHKAIHNVLDAIDAPFVGKKKASAGNPESYYEGEHVENVTDNDDVVDCDVAAGTSWLFADPTHDQRLDYLFVDEAGQVSLADALAMATCARNVILVGDPQQLAQVLQGSHPLGTGASVLTHLLGDADTIPPDCGVFLERTHRLHPDVCTYISEEFYDGRLQPDPVTATRTTPFGTGLRYIEVAHEGNRQDSREEVDAVSAEVDRLLAAGVTDLMVVAPYNAQVNALREALPDDVRVGTVDKFQGQEADVVLYSMASSSGEDVPRGLEFLLSRNRLNVAISRARCLAYLVASPRLLEVNCRTIPQMRLANALCRFVELAQPA
jgi:AAA domain